jgi:hypothetical protein
VRGAVTCEQAYELVVQLLASAPQPVLPAGVLPADLVRLRQQLETVLPERQQTALTEAAADHWTSQRSLPAPSSPDCSRFPHATSSSRAQDHARRPGQPSYHETGGACDHRRAHKHMNHNS